MKKLWIFLAAAFLVLTSSILVSAAEYTIQDGEITVTDVPENAYLLIASYDRRGILQDCKAYEEVSADRTITADYPTTGGTVTRIRPFLWEKGTLRPLPLTEKKADLPKKTLVAYFSATNNTKGIAEKIAEGINADLYRILPQEPYTDEDLNYNNSNSRANREQNNPNARPAISGSVEHMEQYDTVFVGYPIWWGNAPKIIFTFLESYDFDDKTIIPFCTSGSSPIGSTTAMEAVTKGASWLPGRRFSGGASADTVMDWVNSLDLD